MPAYKVTRYITTALDSIFVQTFQDFEVIVVNDGCPDTDNLEQAIKPYRSRIEYIRQENGGVGAARHAAFVVVAARMGARRPWCDPVGRPEDTGAATTADGSGVG